MRSHAHHARCRVARGDGFVEDGAQSCIGGEVSLSAPSEGHMERLVATLPASLLGELESDDVDLPDVLPRVRRERLESML